MKTQTDEAIREKERCILEGFGFESNADMGGTFWEIKQSDGTILSLCGQSEDYDDFDNVLGLFAGMVTLEKHDECGVVLNHINLSEHLGINFDAVVTDENLNAFLNQVL